MSKKIDIVLFLYLAYSQPLDYTPLHCIPCSAEGHRLKLGQNAAQSYHVCTLSIVLLRFIVLFCKFYTKGRGKFSSLFAR